VAVGNERGYRTGNAINIFFKFNSRALEDILLINVGNDSANDEIPVTAERDRNKGLYV